MGCAPAREGVRVHDLGAQASEAAGELGEAVAQELELFELVGSEVEGGHVGEMR